MYHTIPKSTHGEWNALIRSDRKNIHFETVWAFVWPPEEWLRLRQQLRERWKNVMQKNVKRPCSFRCWIGVTAAGERDACIIKVTLRSVFIYLWFWGFVRVLVSSVVPSESFVTFSSCFVSIRCCSAMLMVFYSVRLVSLGVGYFVLILYWVLSSDISNSFLLLPSYLVFCVLLVDLCCVLTVLSIFQFIMFISYFVLLFLNSVLSEFYSRILQSSFKYHDIICVVILAKVDMCGYSHSSEML